MKVTSELAALYARDISRLIQELRAFPDTASVWRTVPGVTNAAGTLALHLEGNLREYIGRQLGKIDFTRDRPLEFSARDVAREDLIARLEAVHEMVPRVIGSLSDLDLSGPYPEKYNGQSLTVRLFLMHLEALLNYHLGQVDYLRRVATGNGAIELANL